MEHSRRENREFENRILSKLKKSLSDVLTPEHTDAFLMKFLRAGGFCLEKSGHLFREMLWSRAVYELDTFTCATKKHPIAERCEFASHLGYAKDGTPVTYVALGRGDLQGFIVSMSAFDICTYCSLVVELDIQRARQSSKKLGVEINEITYVVDMEGFEAKNIFNISVVEMAFDLFRMIQDFYPEIWKNLLVVNAAFYVYQSYNILRPIFRDTFLDKLRIVSKEDTPALLLKYLDPEVLPVFLGGTRVDSKGDAFCSEFIKFGGLVNPVHPPVHTPLTEKDGECVWIPARSCFNHCAVVRKADSRIKIQITTEGGSIATSILYRTFGPKESIDFPSKSEYLNPRDPKCNVCQISPTVKLQTHLCPADTSCRAPLPGIYIFKFDNTSNWLTSRKLLFNISVLPPS